MACKDKRPDHCSHIGEDDKKRKTRFAFKRISKFCSKINEMKTCEKERAGLESKDVGLHYDFHTTGPNPDGATLQTDPVIEPFIRYWASKVVRVVDDLSTELESVNEKNTDFRNSNETLKIEIDNLRAMIRISSGNNMEYRERINEFNNIIVRVSRETVMLKRIFEDASSRDDFIMYQDRMKNVEVLMNELMMKLKNDTEAMLAAESLSLSGYLKKISKLSVCSETLLRQLEKTEAELCARSCCIEWSDKVQHPKVIDSIEKLVKRVGSGLKCLKSVPMKIGTRVGGESCVQYLKQIRTLEKFVASSLSIIDKLIIDSQEVHREKKEKDAENVRISANSRDCIEALEVLAKKLKSGFKELEISVAAGDSTNLIQRIRELESSVKKLKNEVVMKDEKNSTLGLELTGAKIAYAEKDTALKKVQKKYEKLTGRMKKHCIDWENEDQKISSLVRELEQSKLEAAEATNLREELNELRPKLTRFRSENTTLMDEMNKMRDTIKGKDMQLVSVTKQKESIERILTKEKVDTRQKLAIALDEMKSLKQSNLKLKNDLESALKRPIGVDVSVDCQITTIEAAEERKECQRLKAVLEQTTEDLKSRTNEFAILNNQFTKLTAEKTTIEHELSRIKTQNETLIIHLESEKATTSETLQNYDKLMQNFQLLNNDLENITMERSAIAKSLEESEREINATRSEIDEIRQENVILSNEASSLKTQVNNLARELERANTKNLDIHTQLNKLIEEKRAQSISFDSLMKDNEELNNKLDIARSDKLNIAGALNDLRLKYEESNNQLDSKIRELRDLQERLRVALRDLQEAETREASVKLQVARLLDENTLLNETIDVLNRDKTSFEERLESLDNEYRALKNQLAVSENENKKLRDDSSILHQRADKLMDDLKKLTINNEKDTTDTRNLVAEREKTTDMRQRKLDEFEIVHEGLKIELTRLRDENSSLKSEHERITSENETMQSRVGGKNGSELNRVRVENESMKLELTKLRIANTELDRTKLGLPKNEWEKLRVEILTLRKENCAMTMLLNNVQATNKRMEEQRNLLKTANDLLRRDLEDAKNELACGDEERKKSHTTINALKNTLEELEQRNRVSTIDAQEMRSQNVNLDRELRNLKKSVESIKSEDQALRQEIEILRSALKRVNDDNSKRRMDFAETEEELVALKGELSRTRAENEIMRTQLVAKHSEFCRMESEMATLKFELEELKRSKILAQEVENQLRAEYDKLNALKVTLERNLTDALKEIGKYTSATAKLNGLENKLKGVLKDYVVTKKLLRSANDEVNHLRRLTEPRIRSLEYGEKIQAS